MTSLGETLRRERQRRNLDLNQVSRELKISTRFLEAIEAEHFDRLPGGVFAKSFVRQYARMLDLDDDEVAAELQRTLNSTALPQSIKPAPTAASAMEFAPRVEAISNRHFASGSWLPALALTVAVMLGCSMVYGWWQREHKAVAAASPVSEERVPQVPSTAPPTPAPAPVPEPNASASLPTVQQAPEQPAEQAHAAAPAGAAPVAQTVDRAPLRPSGPVKVVITTYDDPVWVLARTDGKYAFSGTLDPNQTRTVDAHGTVLLRLGNAGGVAIVVNGKPIPAVGPKGQVRTVQLTSGGFQIAAPSKPPVTPESPL